MPKCPLDRFNTKTPSYHYRKTNVEIRVIRSLSNIVQSKITKYCIITYTHDETRWYIAGSSRGSRISSSWQPSGNLFIYTMGFSILERQPLYTESAPLSSPTYWARRQTRTDAAIGQADWDPSSGKCSHCVSGVIVKETTYSSRHVVIDHVFP